MGKEDIIILGIESSCDDTAAAVMRNGVLLTNVTATQEVHRQYGGVVPEMASRVHLQNIVPVVNEAINKAGINRHDISGIAVTRGPGLIGSLMVGVSFAKALSFSLDIPLLAVHHMRAHVLAHFIEAPKPNFPFLCLTVSGGHTQIVLVNSYDDMNILGQTQDDAAGEAFDKSAKLLGLSYPGGPLIDKYAQEGNSHAFSFPAPKMDGLDFSFSGLKTSILRFLQNAIDEDPQFLDKNLNDICASIQSTIIEILIAKLEQAAMETGINEIAIAGGVSANSGLRKALTEAGLRHKWQTYIPKFSYCTDNAAMIAMSGHFQFLSSSFANQSVQAVARWAM